MTNLELALSEEVKHPLKVKSVETILQNRWKDVDFKISCVIVPGCFEEDDTEEVPFCDMSCPHCEDIEEDLCADYEPPMWGIPDVERVIFNPPATVVFWMDGTKTVVKAMEGEKFEKYAGFAMACMKKMFGSTGRAKAILAECDDTREIKPKSEPKKLEPKPKKLEPKPKKSSFFTDKSLDDIMKIVFGDIMPYKEEKKDEAPAE